ncbi:Auxin-induced protein 5NG4 [Hordeum vulgare]|nr:Auxin-induced protein 5NG4 [Hordeum vulgare]
MNYNGHTFRFPHIVPERRYPIGIAVETTLRVWAISRWRGPREFAQVFLRVGFGHLPSGSPVMFRLEEMRPNASSVPTTLLANFTNRFDAFYLLGKMFWCDCEFIAFTTYKIFTDVESIFPTLNAMHNLPTTPTRMAWRRTTEDGTEGRPVSREDGVVLMLP